MLVRFSSVLSYRLGTREVHNTYLCVIQASDKRAIMRCSINHHKSVMYNYVTDTTSRCNPYLQTISNVQTSIADTVMIRGDM